MERNILLGGSITAVVIIVLASFTNVVGYHLIESHQLNESPLFSIRTQNAIQKNEGNKIISEYLGKGKNSSIMISKRGDTLEKVQEVINRIKLMDDDTFKTFVNTVVHELSQQRKNYDLEPEKIIDELYQLRSTSKTFEGKEINSDDDRTWRATPTLCWFPGCILLNIAAFILLLIFLVIVFGFIWPTALYTCGDDCYLPLL